MCGDSAPRSTLKDTLFLKGGNALRKAYFENTRYSADLDFGIPNDVDPNFLLQQINRVCDLIHEKSSVTFVKDRNQVDEKFPPGENAPLPDLKVPLPEL
jgi:predicted nucleotidyltransferase component of viral defense system